MKQILRLVPARYTALVHQTNQRERSCCPGRRLAKLLAPRQDVVGVNLNFASRVFCTLPIALAASASAIRF